MTLETPSETDSANTAIFDGKTAPSNPAYSNFAQSIGFNIIKIQGDQALTEIERTPFNADYRNLQRIDPLVIPGLIDHSAGLAIYTHINRVIGISTFDLRIDLLHETIVGKLLATTRVISNDGNSALILSHVEDAEKLVAQGTGVFRLGSFPAGAGDTNSTTFDLKNEQGPLRSLLNLTASEQPLCYPAENLAVIGWKGAHALHGGAIAALLVAACEQKSQSLDPQRKPQRLASLNINFVRPGLGGVSLYTETKIIRQGKAGSTLQSRCFHETDKTVAIAQATLVSGV